MISVPKRPGTVELLFKSALAMDLQPEWITQNGLFVITSPTGEHYINHERSSLNSHVSISLARNKYHTRLVLDRHNLPNIPYTKVKSLPEAEAFLAAHGTVIAKPLKGGGSVGIHIIRSAAQLQGLVLSDYILERYTPGKEMRYLVLQNKVIGVHESKYGESVAADRDLERISYDATTWDSKLVALSLETLRVLGLSFGTVDYMLHGDNEHYIIEVNSRPGFKWFHAPSEGPSVDVASMFLGAVIRSGS